MELAAAMAADAGPTVEDLAAFERLVREHERRVYRTALHLLGNHADAEDAAQEVFLRLHRNYRRLAAEPDLAPWIYRVAVNVCRDAARRRRRTEELADTASFALSAEDEVGLAERAHVVRRALRSLPEKQRAAVVLRDMEGLPTHEVAAVLGTSEATVRSHISAARLRIKAFVDGWTRRRV
jgi:RNA polymerase sigma-70 factor (ECF subfamily)